jgi:excisionase family DNA binding protein
MTVQQVADLLQVSRDWVYRHVADGTLPHRKLGAHLRFVRADIEKWLLQQPGKGAA